MYVTVRQGSLKVLDCHTDAVLATFGSQGVPHPGDVSALRTLLDGRAVLCSSSVDHPDNKALCTLLEQATQEVEA